jgi:hypothetical protein
MVLLVVIAVWVLCSYGYKEIEHEGRIGWFSSKIKARK